jgi:hypothetical protein
VEKAEEYQRAMHQGHKARLNAEVMAYEAAQEEHKIELAKAEEEKRLALQRQKV